MGNISRFLIGAFFGGCAVVIFSFLIPRNDPYVQLSVKNDAENPIQKVRVDSGGDVYLIENVPVGSFKSLKLYSAGESTFKVTVTFANGKTLQGGSEYVESGYKVTEHVTNEKIESDINLHGIY